MFDKQPTNSREAFTMALFLAITAPEDKTEESMKMVIDLAQGMSDYEVHVCRRDALRMLKDYQQQQIRGGS